MSFSVLLYKFNKKPNSTKIPDGGGTSINVDIWEPCDMAKPVLKVELGMDVITKYTYVQIPIWGKMYFVEKYSWERGYVLIHLTPDVMGTYKQFITARSQYIARSNVVYDSSIVDSFYPSTYHKTSAISRGTDIFDGSGCYVMGVAGVGGTKYYALTLNQLRTITAYMFSTPQESLWDQIVAATAQNFLRTFIDPYSYIRECYYIPVSVPGGDASAVYIGYWNTGVSAPVARIGSTLHFSQQSISVPQNPYATGAKAFLQGDSHTTYVLNIPYCGSVEIPAAYSPTKGTYNDVNLEYRIDYTGHVFCRVLSGGYLIATLAGDCATPIAISQNTVNQFEVASGAIQMAAGSAVVASGHVGGAAEIGGGALTILNSMIPRAESKGSSGGYAESLINKAPVLTCYFSDISSTSSKEIGHPCYKHVVPSSPGWYQCADAQIDWIDEMYEMQLTKNYMDTGFWVE